MKEIEVIEEEPFLEPSYVMKKLVIGRRAIKNFMEIKPPYGHRRKWRKGHSQRITAIMNKGKHFQSPLVLEKNNITFRVIDGWHRICSIKKWLEKCNGKIAVYCAIYEPLTNEERRLVYRSWNIGIAQSTDDFIESYRDDISIFPKMIAELPCNSYGGRDELNGGYKIKFKSLVGGYIASRDTGKFKGGYQGGPDKFVSDAQELTDKDVNQIKAFWDVMKKAYNISDNSNFSDYDCLRTSPFYALFRIWYINRKKFNKAEIIARFQKTPVKTQIEEFAPLGGRESCKKARDVLVDALNRNYDEASKLFEVGF